MSAAGLIILVTVAVAGAGEDAAEPVTITMFAASATSQGPVVAQKKDYGGLAKSMVPSKDKRKAKKHFDPELKDIEAAVEDLPYDTYRKVNVLTERVNMNEEAAFAITPEYTLRARPLEKDKKSRVRMELRIDEKVEVDRKVEVDPKVEAKGKGKDEKEPVVREALATTSSIVPGKPLVLGGLKLDEGRLVVVLSLEP